VNRHLVGTRGLVTYSCVAVESDTRRSLGSKQHIPFHFHFLFLRPTYSIISMVQVVSHKQAMVDMIMIIITIIFTTLMISQPCDASLYGVTVGTPSSSLGGDTTFKITYVITTSSISNIDIDLIGPTKKARVASSVAVYYASWTFTLSRATTAYRSDIQALPAGSGYKLRITDSDSPTQYVESNAFTWNGPLTSPYVPPIDIKYRFTIRTSWTSSSQLYARTDLRTDVIQWLSIPSSWLGAVSSATSSYESYYYVVFDVYGPNNASAAVTTTQKAQETASAWSIVTRFRDLTNTSSFAISLPWVDTATIYVDEISWLRCVDDSGEVSLAESCPDDVLSDLSTGAVVGIVFGVLCCACMVLSLSRQNFRSTTSRGKNMRVTPQRVYVASNPVAAPPAPAPPVSAPRSTANVSSRTGEKPAKKVNAVVGGQVSAQVTGIVSNGASSFQSQQQTVVVVDNMASSSIQSSQQQMMSDSQQQQQSQQHAPVSPNPPPKVPLGDAQSFAPPSYETPMTNNGLPTKDEFVPVDKSLV